MSNPSYMNDVIEDLIEDPNSESWGVLSTGEQCYVFLAANRPDLARNMSVAYMVKRIGEEWRQELMESWGDI